jgi:hypothetical protein
MARICSEHGIERATQRHFHQGGKPARRSKMKTTVKLLAGLLLLTGSELQAQTEGENKMAGYKSFAWAVPGVSIPESEEEIRQLVQREVDKRLASLGYKSASAGEPDFYMAFHLVGKLPGATLVLDIIDRESGRLVWRSLDSNLSGRSLWTARFSNYETYAWKRIEGLGETPLYETSDQLLRRALEEEIVIRDYALARGSDADMHLNYHVVGEGADARKPMQGTLYVQLLASESNELLWEGRTSTNIGSPEDREAQIRAVVKELCLDLPKYSER